MLVALLGLLSFAALIVGIVAVIKGNILSLGIKNRKVGAVVILTSIILFVAMSGIDSSPSTKTDTAKDAPPPVVQTQEEPEGLEQIQNEASEQETTETIVSDLIEEQAEQDYINFVVKSSTEISKALQDVGMLCQSMSFTEEWIIKTAAGAGTIKFYCNEVLEKQPPERFKDIHDLFVRACSYYILAMDSLAAGIDNLDVDEIEKAAAYMSRGSEFINAASAEIQNLKD